MSDRLQVLLADVFTDRAYAGNPLAVCIDPPVLSPAQRQRLAGELNLSETIFLARRGDGGYDARIHTPATELPFAGHPTVGAALVLVAQGLVADPGEVVLHEGVGPVTVRIEAGVATLRTPVAPRAVDVADPDDVAACCGLELGDLHPALGPRGWTVGVPYTLVGVRDAGVLGRVAIDLARWRDTVGRSDAPDLYLVAPLDGLDGRRWQARMFGPSVGVAEDPATGSAAAAAAGYLAGHVGAQRLEDGWVIHQGIEMGRPSELAVRAVLRGSELVAVEVGGRAVLVGASMLSLPPG